VEAFGKYSISAAGRIGLDDLKSAWWSRLLEMRKAAELERAEEARKARG